MRLHFDNIDLRARSGPNTFAGRLSLALTALGHDCQPHSVGADASLVFIEPSGAPLAPKVVHRLDGIWFKPWEYEQKNAAIRSQFDRADAVVFQSQFDREFVERRWGGARPHRHAVIGNGVTAEPLKQLTIPKLIEMREKYDQIYVCSSNWHPQKRLEANVRLFQHLCKQHPNSCLIIMGDHPDHRATGPNVFYTGPVGPEIYMQVYAAANWMLHLAWADHCPNVVVEALSQGTPAVCSEVGGTKELIRGGAYGVVLCEEPYDYELYDYDNPPHIDVEQVTDLPERRVLDYTGIKYIIDIDLVAKRYEALFEQLVKRV